VQGGAEARLRRRDLLGRSLRRRARAALPGPPGRTGTGLLEAARTTLTHGLDNAAPGANIIMVAAVVLSVAFVREVRVESPPAAAGEPRTEADEDAPAVWHAPV